MSNPPLDLKRYIRDIADFPKPGILFRDITPLLADPEALRETVRRMADPYRDKKINAVVAAEARGFIFAAPMAIELNAGFVPLPAMPGAAATAPKVSSLSCSSTIIRSAVLFPTPGIRMSCSE